MEEDESVIEDYAVSSNVMNLLLLLVRGIIIYTCRGHSWYHLVRLWSSLVRTKMPLMP